jgi:hypothetical protein
VITATDPADCNELVEVLTSIEFAVVAGEVPPEVPPLPLLLGAGTVTLSDITLFAESSSFTTAVPAPTPPTANIVPLTDAETIDGAPLVATYGGFPPKMLKLCEAPMASVKSLGAVVKNVEVEPTPTPMETIDPRESLNTTFVLPAATPIIEKLEPESEIFATVASAVVILYGGNPPPISNV